MTENALQQHLDQQAARDNRLCDRCGVKPGTQRFGEGVIAMIHGVYEMYCTRCVTEVQLAHAKENAKKIPKLESKLAKLGGPMKKKGAKN